MSFVLKLQTIYSQLKRIYCLFSGGIKKGLVQQIKINLIYIPLYISCIGFVIKLFHSFNSSRYINKVWKIFNSVKIK